MSFLDSALRPHTPALHRAAWDRGTQIRHLPGFANFEGCPKLRSRDKSCLKKSKRMQNIFMMSKVLAFYAETGSAGLMRSYVCGLMGFSFSFFPQGFT